MRYYNPQLQQPVSMFVQDQTPWEMMFKNLDRKEADWAKGEAMPGEFDVIASALKTAPGHEDWGNDLVNNTKKQLNAAIEEAKGNYSDPTFQRKAKNIIMSFGSNKDVIELQRSREYYDKYGAPIAADPRNANAIIDMPGIDPFTHEFTGEQHKKAYTTPRIINDPKTLEAFDEQLKQVRPDSFAVTTGLAISDGVDASGAPLYKWDETKEAAKEYKQDKLDKAAYQFATDISTPGSEYYEYEQRKATKSGYDVSTPEKLRDYLYNKHKGLGIKYQAKDTEKSTSSKPIGGNGNKSNRGNGNGDEEKPNQSTTVSGQVSVIGNNNFKNSNGDRITSEEGINLELTSYQDKFNKTIEKSKNNISNIGVETTTGFDIAGRQILIPIGSVTPQQQSIIDANNVELIKDQSMLIGLQETKNIFAQKHGFNPEESIESQLSPDIIAEGNKIRNSTVFGEMLNQPLPKNASQDARNLQEKTKKETEEKVIEFYKKKAPKYASYLNDLNNYLTGHTYKTEEEYDFETADSKEKANINTQLKLLFASANSNDWSYVSDDSKNLTDAGLKKIFNDAEIDNNGNILKAGVTTSFRYDSQQAKYVPMVTITEGSGEDAKTHKLQYNGEINNFAPLADKITGMSSEYTARQTLMSRLAESGRTSAYFELNRKDNKGNKIKINKDNYKDNVIDIRIARSNINSNGVVIPEGSYMFKLPGDENIYISNNDKEFLDFTTTYQQLIASGDVNSEKNAKDFINYHIGDKKTFSVANDIGLDKSYFTRTPLKLNKLPNKLTPPPK